MNVKLLAAALSAEERAQLRADALPERKLQPTAGEIEAWNAGMKIDALRARAKALTQHIEQKEVEAARLQEKLDKIQAEIHLTRNALSKVEAHS